VPWMDPVPNPGPRFPLLGLDPQALGGHQHAPRSGGGREGAPGGGPRLWHARGQQGRGPQARAGMGGGRDVVALGVKEAHTAMPCNTS
jgi:hypothetical protein